MVELVISLVNKYLIAFFQELPVESSKKTCQAIGSISVHALGVWKTTRVNKETLKRYFRNLFSLPVQLRAKTSIKSDVVFGEQ